MKPKLTELAGAALVIVVTCLMSGCRPEHSPQPSSVSTNEFQAERYVPSPSSTNEYQADYDIMDGTEKMRSAYIEALFAGKVRRGEDIPPRYWSDFIKALHPIRVYSDHGNTVVVQKTVNGIEYGCRVVLKCGLAEIPRRRKFSP